MTTASSLEVTPGSGLKLATGSYTEGAVTVHDQKILHGEPYVPTYTTFPDNTGPVTLATANSHPIQIMAGASLRLRIRRIAVYQVGLATTATTAAMLITRLTTAGTGGTANSRSPLDPADGAAGATQMTLPTVKGTEGVVLWMGSMYLTQTASASTPIGEPILDIDFDKLRATPLIIAAGATNGIALKNQTAVAGASIYFTVWFSETSW